VEIVSDIRLIHNRHIVRAGKNTGKFPGEVREQRSPNLFPMEKRERGRVLDHSTGARKVPFFRGERNAVRVEGGCYSMRALLCVVWGKNARIDSTFPLTAECQGS
jgi:hypothetical protein